MSSLKFSWQRNEKLLYVIQQCFYYGTANLPKSRASDPHSFSQTRDRTGILMRGWKPSFLVGLIQTCRLDPIRNVVLIYRKLRKINNNMRSGIWAYFAGREMFFLIKGSIDVFTTLQLLITLNVYDFNFHFVTWL